MQNGILNFETVSNFLQGKCIAQTYFHEMMDYREMHIRSIGVGEFECYTDSGSEDYFYFKVEKNDN